jgi:hypothetical protein
VAIFAGSRFAAKNSKNKAPELWVLILQSLIPPVALLGWTMLQPVSAFDVLNEDLNLGIDLAARQVIAVIGAAFLGIAAGWLGYKVDSDSPTPN